MAWCSGLASFPATALPSHLFSVICRKVLLLVTLKGWEEVGTRLLVGNDTHAFVISHDYSQKHVASTMTCTQITHWATPFNEDTPPWKTRFWIWTVRKFHTKCPLGLVSQHPQDAIISEIYH